MASIPPPDPSSPGAIAGATFPAARKGFDPSAVRDFLRQVSQELGRAQHERERLVRELDEARETARRASSEHMDEATVAAKLGEEAARVLSTAHEAATQIRAKAEETSARLLRDSELDAARQRGDAEVEAARRRQEAQDAAEAEIDAAKAEGREMVAEARELRERIFADLTRRRDLARRQIESLHSGNRQMMDALRGARRELDGILASLEVEAAEELDDELPPLELPDRSPAADPPKTAVLVLGEMDVPAAIVERHLEPVPTAPEEIDEGEDEVEDGELLLDDEGVEDDLDDDDDVDEDDEDDEDGDHDDAGGDEADEPADAIIDEEVDEEVEEAVEAVEAVDGPEQITDEVPVIDPEAGSASVDDLFARLRASSSEVVAREVLEPVTGDAPPAADGAAEPWEASPGAGAAALAQRQEVLAPVRVALARQLKRVLADEQNEVLDRLRRRGASLAADHVLGAADAHAGTYREAAEDHVWAAATAGADALSDLDGEELHAALEARSVLDRSLDTLEAELVVPLRARLVENLEAAGDPTEAASTMRATYREWKGRIDELGEDIVRTAYGRASYAVLDPGTAACWVFDPSGPACADAEDNVLAGAVPAGEPFPTGHRYAPAYRGCRCLLVVPPG